MSKEELVERYKAALESDEVSTKEGLKAAAIVAEEANKTGIECAVAGGMAMHVFGYKRATKDVDLLASDILARPSNEPLSFGGESYLVQVGERTITVDVIVRDDFFRNFYEAALQDAEPMPSGLRVVTPAWMVILKYLSGRSKDILDLLWMLREPGLIDRAQVAQLLKQVMGESGAQVALRGLEPYYLQAEVMRGGDENGRQER